MLPQCHVKDPDDSAKSAGGSLHLKHAYTSGRTFDSSWFSAEEALNCVRKMQGYKSVLQQTLGLKQRIFDSTGFRRTPLPDCFRDAEKRKGNTKAKHHFVHSAKRASGRLHLTTHSPLIQRSRCGLTMLSRHSVGTNQGKRAETQLVGKHSATVVSAR